MLKLSVDERALIRAIACDFDNDMPRLVYADWLDEQGRCERAEFIRLQCADARGVIDWHGKQREQELFQRYNETWVKELPKWAITRKHGYWQAFERGFLSEHQGIAASMFVRYGPQLLDRTPVRLLGIIEPSSVMDEMISCPWLREIPNLTFKRQGFDDSYVERLMTSEWLIGTRSLSLADHYLRDRAIRAIARCRHLCNLEQLDLRNNLFTVHGIRYLAESDHLRNVRTFRFTARDDFTVTTLRQILGDRWSDRRP